MHLYQSRWRWSFYLSAFKQNFSDSHHLKAGSIGLLRKTEKRPMAYPMDDSERQFPFRQNVFLVEKYETSLFCL